MKRKLTSILLVSALLVVGASTFVSCKDYDGDQTAVTNAGLTVLQDSVKKHFNDLDEIVRTLGGENHFNETKDALDSLRKVIANAGGVEEWVKLNTELEKLRGQCEALARIAGNEAMINNLVNMSTSWGEGFKNVVVRAELADSLAKYATKDDLLKLWPAAEALFEKKADMKADVEKFINEITKANAENFSTYAELVAAFDKVPARLQQISDSLNMIIGYVDNLQLSLNNTITGVNVDMINNPYFGTFNTPFGVKSNMLIGFVGSREIDNETADAFGVKAGKACSLDGGKVYFTVNPNDIDATGLTFSLVGRDGSEAPGYKLMPAAKDYTKVTTRAAVNGYAAVAGITNADAAKVNVNKDALTKVAKNVLEGLRGQKNIEVLNAVKTIYSTFTNAIPQYYALQAEYKVKDAKTGEEVKKAYTSDYNIAAVTVHPLSYQTLAGKGYTIPSIPQLEDVLGINLSEFQFSWDDLEHMKDMEASITIEVPDPQNITINNVPAPDVFINDDKIQTIVRETKDENGVITKVEAEVKIEDGFVTVGNIDFSNAEVEFDTKEETYSVTVSMKDFNDMIDKINGSVGGMMGKVNDLIGTVESGLDKVNNSVISRLNSVIARVNKITENPNALLQPVMLYSDANGAGRMSESSIAPTRFYLNGKSEGSIVLVPTSYTAEMLAPAYKKSITIKDGNGASLSQSGVMDGDTRTVVFTAKPGKYTIEYKAMDYDGYTRTKTYYVEVK